LIFASILLLQGCTSSTYHFRELSEFRLDKNALKDGESVQIIYSSGGPDYNPNLEYYYHLIVVSHETGDTVNVLTTLYNPDETYLTKDFISNENNASKIMQNLDKIKNGSNVNDLSTKAITKVASNRDHLKREENNYPSVIGTLGEVEQM